VARATTTSEDLVPKGLPQGGRQQIVQQMQEADVPLSSEGGGSNALAPSSNAASPGPLAPAPPVSRQDLSSFDALANRQPTEGFQATPQRQVMFEKVRQSDNLVMQSIFQRMAGYKEG